MSSTALSIERVLTALGLPDSARLDQRVPKSLFLEHATPTATDKRLLQDGIEEIRWHATLKASTVSVPSYSDPLREYLEIAVIGVNLRPSTTKPSNIDRLRALLHRAIPYPVVLMMQGQMGLDLSVAHKRWSQNEIGKVVLDGDTIHVSLPHAADPEDLSQGRVIIDFVAGISLGAQPAGSLLSLYQGWMDTISAMQIAQRTGQFFAPKSAEELARRRQALQDCEQLEQQIARLRAEAPKERQMARKVEINLALQRALAALADANGRLG